MTDQPIANSELSEQLDSLSNALDTKISSVSQMLERSEQLCSSVQQSESAVAAAHQEIMGAIARGGLVPEGEGDLADRLEAVESQLSQLMEVLPRLAKDVKIYARLAQHMDQCAAEVSQWHGELQQIASQPKGVDTDLESTLMEMQSAINSYGESQQAMAEQLAMVQSQAPQTTDLSFVETRIEQLENATPRDVIDLGALNARFLKLENTPTATIDEGQMQQLVESLITDRETALKTEMNAIQQDWQTGASILQQMQVRIESLEVKGGESPVTSAQLEGLRSEMSNLVAKSKTEQESGLREQRKQLQNLDGQGGKITAALVLGVVGVGCGIVGIVR